MARALGFRMEVGTIHWAVVEGPPESPVLIAPGTVSAPKGYDEPQSLTHLRDCV